MKRLVRGGPFEGAARSAYYRFRSVLTPAKWYQETDEHAKYVHITEAVNYLRVAGMPKVSFEFGCHSGRTFSAALLAARFFGIALDAYAFDSFEGLPENDEGSTGIFRGGTFRTDVTSFKAAVRSRSGVEVADDHIVKGFFDQSLTHELAQRLPAHVGMIHIDVDLYKSTVPALEFIRSKLVDGSVILFDDWYCFPPGRSLGEKRATEEFLARYPDMRFEAWKSYSGFGRSFFVVRDGGGP